MQFRQQAINWTNVDENSGQNIRPQGQNELRMDLENTIPIKSHSHRIWKQLGWRFINRSYAVVLKPVIPDPSWLSLWLGANFHIPGISLILNVIAFQFEIPLVSTASRYTRY